MARPLKKNDDEKRTARISLLLTPAMHADITTLARVHGVSVNDYFCALAEKDIKKNRRTIDKVNAVMSEAFAEMTAVDDESEENL